MTRKTSGKVVAGVLVLALAGGACSSGGGEKSTTATTKPAKYDAEKGLASPAATLRAELTAGLQEYVLLVAMATSAQVAGQDPAPIAAGADQTTSELAAVLAGVYQQPAGDQFLGLWKRQTAGLLQFSAASVKGDQAGIAAAKTALEGVQGEVVTMLNTLNPQLTPDALGDELKTFVNGFQTALTAQAKKDAEVGDKVKKVADNASKLAIVLSAGIVKQKKKDVPGKLDTMGAVMRAELTAKLQEHSYLTGIASGLALTGSDRTAADKVLDDNSIELSRPFSAVYGDDAGTTFLKLWRAHIGFLDDFTEGAAAGDQAKMAAARSALDGYRREFAAFLGRANPNLSEEDLAVDLGAHIDSQLAVIEAQAAKDPSQVAKLRTAAGHMPDTALHLAEAIARQFPTKFG